MKHLPLLFLACACANPDVDTPLLTPETKCVGDHGFAVPKGEYLDVDVDGNNACAILAGQYNHQGPIVCWELRPKKCGMGQ
jgi:hypothetical protein